ncbi:hypothetical protein KR059_000378, partial [Drosophila kikkawai]
MRIATPQPPILFVLLVHLLVAGVASSQFGGSYQQSRSGNCRQEDQPGAQNLNGCETGGGCGGGGMDSGSSRSRPLNPKQIASNIAQQAAQDAKKASDTQVPAAVEAARQVKLQLADRAGAAAWAAEAALVGKQQIVEQLRAEVQEADSVFQDETASVSVSQNNLNTAICTAKQANDLMQKIQGILGAAQDTVKSAETAVCSAHDELQEKNKLVDAAQRRVELLLQELRNAKLDYDNTKKSAYKAACAAAEARQKASRERRSGKNYREPQHYQNLAREQFQGEEQKHQQTQVQAPLQEIKKQPEEWKYNQQVKAKLAA